jgi:hypothetical protein
MRHVLKRFSPCAVPGIVAFPILAALATGGQARADEPTRDELVARIEQLQARVQALEGKQKAGAEEGAREVDRAVAGALSDAEQRSRGLHFGSDLTAAGYDKSFFLRSTDGNFSLRPGVHFQFRHVTTYRQDEKNGDNDDIQSGFEVRRLKVSLEGNVFRPEFTYFFQWATERGGGSVVLDDAWVRYQFADRWALKLGQYKDPVFHEELTPDKTLLTVERSLLNEVLGGGLTGRVQGASVIYGNDKADLQGEFMVHDGARTLNTNFTDSPGGLGVVENFGVGGRVAYKFMGNWKDYRDFTAKETKEPMLIAGVGAEFTEGQDVGALLSTVDVQYEHPSGLSLYGALVGDYRDTRNGDSGNAFDWGAIAQVGYLLSPNWEVFGAYDILLFEDDVAFPGGGSEDVFHEIVGGVNYYLGKGGAYGHRAKFTADVVVLPAGAPRSVSGNGILAGDDLQLVFRAQFQLLL